MSFLAPIGPFDSLDPLWLAFFVGLHKPAHAAHFPRACLSINTLWGRRLPVDCPEVLIDSGAFTELEKHGAYRHPVEVYGAEVRRLHDEGILRIIAVVAQDYMCEPFMLQRTGLTVLDHQRLTIERYDALLACGLPVPVIPVLQGYHPEDYVRHLRMYGDRLTPGLWVGVGSLCKRNGDPRAILRVLAAIKAERPDLRLHGFGVKTLALLHPGVRVLLHSADSMAWSAAAARQSGFLVRQLGRELGRRVKPSEARPILAARGIHLRNPNDWREAVPFVERIMQPPPSHAYQMEMPL